MKILCCVAGFPQQVVEAVQSRPVERFTGAKESRLIIRRIKEPFHFREGMAAPFLTDLAGEVSQLNPRDEVAVVVVYADFDHAATEAFVGSFFPFALCAPITPFYPDAAPRQERRQALSTFVDSLEDQLQALVARARIVRDRLSGQNFSPLLLPLCNFRSDVLLPSINALYQALGVDNNPAGCLEDAKAALLVAHPVKLEETKGEKKKRFFEDNRSLRFHSPGSDRHGMARALKEGHNHRCLIGARVRLGGPFDSQFHYDCSDRRGGVDQSYPNCHNEEMRPANADNVNIAPNDYIR
mgnify:FL=1